MNKCNGTVARARGQTRSSQCWHAERRRLKQLRLACDNMLQELVGPLQNVISARIDITVAELAQLLTRQAYRPGTIGFGVAS